MSVATRVTMAQVAEKAGVSRSAVSAAFSSRPSTVVLNPATREQIRQVAEELGYRPNILSRSFIKQRSYLIGLLGREVFFLFALETIKGIEQVLEATDYSLLTFYHGSWADDQAKHLKKSVTRRVDGLIIVGAPERPDGANHRQIKELRESGMPIVQIYRRIFPDVPVVMMDEEEAGRMAVRHLVSLGHRRIAHVTYRGWEDQQLPGMEAEAHRRCEGYLQGMGEAGLKPTILTFDRSGSFGLGANDYSWYCEVPARELISAQPRFTAATTFNDYTTIGLIHNLHGMGVRVPDDISIVGYDNAEVGMLMRPALTTMRPKLFDIGEIAGRMLLGMMNGEAGRDVVLTPDLVTRGSSGPVPRAEPR